MNTDKEPYFPQIFPKDISLEKFQMMFPDDWSCAEFLYRQRWPKGFVCPHCGSRKGWQRKTRPWIWECSGFIEKTEAEEPSSDEGTHTDLVPYVEPKEHRPCHKQTSLIAGTLMHKTHLPLRTWFTAIYLVATHSNGMSARQLRAKLGTTYKTAWLLLHKIRLAMVNPFRSKLGANCDNVEVDETSIVYRQAHEPDTGRQGRSSLGKISLICAVEGVGIRRCGRVRLEKISDYGQDTLHDFVLRHISEGTHIVTDGNPSYRGLKNYTLEQKVVRKKLAHEELPRVHLVISLLKRWAMGVYHGLRLPHIDTYLQEFTFRFNRRKNLQTVSPVKQVIHNLLMHEPRPYESIRAKKPGIWQALYRKLKRMSLKRRVEFAEFAVKCGIPDFFMAVLIAVFPLARQYNKGRNIRPVLPRRKSTFAFRPY